MTAFRRLAVCLGVAFWLAGCSMGGLGSIGPVASAPPVPAAPPPIVYGAFLDGPTGQKLSPADRDKALAATEDALASGQRKTWRGEHGTFGYVEAAAPVTAADGGGDTCRAFTSTVYLAGRPEVGHGRGCQNPDGSYRVAG